MLASRGSFKNIVEVFEVGVFEVCCRLRRLETSCRGLCCRKTKRLKTKSGVWMHLVYSERI